MASSTLKGNQRRYEYEVLCRLREVLPDGAKLTVVADRGFADCKLFYALTTELGFEYVIRLRAPPTRHPVAPDPVPVVHSSQQQGY